MKILINKNVVINLSNINNTLVKIINISQIREAIPATSRRRFKNPKINKILGMEVSSLRRRILVLRKKV